MCGCMRPISLAERLQTLPHLSLRPDSISPGFQGKWLSPPSLPCSPNPSLCRPREAGSAWKGDWGGPRVLWETERSIPQIPVSQSRTLTPWGYRWPSELGLLLSTSSGPEICQHHFSLSLCPGLCVQLTWMSMAIWGQGLFYSF